MFGNKECLIFSQHHEREEAIKTEYRKILEQKEQVHQENLKHTNEMSGRLNNYEAELGDLREDKKKVLNIFFFLKSLNKYILFVNKNLE